MLVSLYTPTRKRFSRKLTSILFIPSDGRKISLTHNERKWLFSVSYTQSAFSNKNIELKIFQRRSRVEKTKSVATGDLLWQPRNLCI